MPTRSTFAVQRLTEDLQPWIEQDHWPVAEAAFAALQKALPAASRFDAELAVVRLSVNRVLQRDQRLLRAGLSRAPRTRSPAQAGPPEPLFHAGRPGAQQCQTAAGPRPLGHDHRPLSPAGV